MKLYVGQPAMRLSFCTKGSPAVKCPSCPYLNVAAIMIMMLMSMSWVCRAGAARPFPQQFSRGASTAFHKEAIDDEYHKQQEREDLLAKYFKGIKSLQFNSTTSVNGGGGAVFDESKRRVPSCPDPLHN